MSKEGFLQRLSELLGDISKEEREEALEFYRNYFEEAGKDQEEEILKELGSPEKAAAQIKDGLAGKEPETYGESSCYRSFQREEDERKKQRGGKTLLLICLGILAVPIGIPLLIALLATVFAVGLTVLMVVFSAGLLVFALTFAGIVSGAVCFWGGALSLGSAPASGIFLCGIGFLSLAVGILCLLAGVWLTSQGAPWVFRKIKGFLKRAFQKKGGKLA